MENKKTELFNGKAENIKNKIFHLYVENPFLMAGVAPIILRYNWEFLSIIECALFFQEKEIQVGRTQDILGGVHEFFL